MGLAAASERTPNTDVESDTGSEMHGPRSGALSIPPCESGAPQAFRPQGPVEALNVRLPMLLVGMGSPMPCSILVNQLGKHPFELWPAIGLDDLHRAGEAASHGRAQQYGPMLTRESGLQDHIGFLPIDIQIGEGNHLAKNHCIHLNDGTRCRGDRDEAVWLIGLSPETEGHTVQPRFHRSWAPKDESSVRSSRAHGREWSRRGA